MTNSLFMKYRLRVEGRVFSFTSDKFWMGVLLHVASGRRLRGGVRIWWGERCEATGCFSFPSFFLSLR